MPGYEGRVIDQVSQGLNNTMLYVQFIPRLFLARSFAEHSYQSPFRELT
jgi:hypothetical protein